jgi:ribonuclease VapC
VGAAPLIADSSALVAILKDEPEREEMLAMIASEVTKVSAATVLETSIVVTRSRFGDLDQLLFDGEITTVPFDAAQAEVAREAYARFGKKSTARAKLNFGDCIAYALAKATGEPLLFKGDDFTDTDIESAL